MIVVDTAVWADWFNGADSPQEGRLLGLPLLALDVDGHAEAARLYRRLRARGVTVRGTIDCIIAQTCITAGVELLSTDQHFATIVRHTPLRHRTLP